jgi:tetratricopeptide repeat protein 8
MDPAFYALSLLRRRKLDEAIDKSTDILARNPYDQQVWYIKTRALTLKSWIDDTEMEEEGVAEVLLDDHAMSTAPRPGTSLAKPQGTGVQRPMSTSGRPTSGYARPGSSSQRGASAAGVEAAFQGSRPGTSRPVSSSGRFVRLGTASMKSEPGGPFINVERLDMKRYAQRPAIAKALCEYILYVDHNPRRALELCSEATTAREFQDWYWKARLGKCYYQLGLYRDAERQFKSALKHAEIVGVLLELGKVYMKLDQPLTALEVFEASSNKNKMDINLLVAMARLFDQLNDEAKSVALYRRVLSVDSSSVEAIACLASHHFFEDQPEIALRLYRRLLQMGVSSTELWNNLGLCCYFASQFDMTLSCFERALGMASDDNMADVWFNIGQLALGSGDVVLAYQAFKVAVSIDANHAESLNNLAILELRKGNADVARTQFATAARVGSFLLEPLYNGALMAFKAGEFQESFDLANKALEVYPNHSEASDLRKQLKQHFSAL